MGWMAGKWGRGMRYVARPLVVVLAGVLAGCGASSAAQGPAAVTAAATCPAAAGSLTGVVTLGGRLAQDAVIYLWPPAGGPLATLSAPAHHGRFSLPLDGVGRVAPGEYEVEAYRAGYTSRRRTVRVTTSALCLRLPLTRNPRSETASLQVTVAASLRRGIVRPTVAVQAPDGHTVSLPVGSSGVLTFALNTVGSYAVTLSRGSQALETTVVLVPPRSATGPLARPSPLAVTFPLPSPSSTK